ncbi:MAG: hypothetical protein HY716_16940 [Planctomycetes bacterium]|nr:hypothetical protein [Planctomycetota bacterium]
MKRALPLVLAAVLAGAARQEAKEELQSAVRKTGELKSYAFKGDVDTEAQMQGIQFRRRGGDEEEEEGQLESFKGKYQKDVGAVANIKSFPGVRFREGSFLIQERSCRESPSERFF